MDYLGDFHLGQTVYCYISTHDSSGANVAPSDAFEAADVVVYQNGSATQITSGITVTSPFDSETGFHLVSIDLNNSAYSRAQDYTIVLAPDTETVDSQTITAIPIGAFSVENRHMTPGGFRTTIATLASQTSFTLTDGPIEDDALNGCDITIKDLTGDHQYKTLEVTDYTGSTKTVTCAADPLSAWTAAVGDVVEVSLVQRKVVNDLATIEGQTDDIGTAGAGLTGIPWNAAWDSEVQSEVNDALVALHLDHLLAADYDPASKPGVSTALLNELVENDSGVSRLTANALEQAPTDVNVASMDANTLTASALAADAVTEIWAKVCESEGSYTAQQILSLLLSVLAGVTTSSGNTLQTPNGNATRVTATVSSNERTAMTLNPSS